MKITIGEGKVFHITAKCHYFSERQFLEGHVVADTAEQAKKMFLENIYAHAELGFQKPSHIYDDTQGKSVVYFGDDSPVFKKLPEDFFQINRFKVSDKTVKGFSDYKQIKGLPLLPEKFTYSFDIDEGYPVLCIIADLGPEKRHVVVRHINEYVEVNTEESYEKFQLAAEQALAHLYSVIIRNEFKHLNLHIFKDSIFLEAMRIFVFNLLR